MYGNLNLGENHIKVFGIKRINQKHLTSAHWGINIDTNSLVKTRTNIYLKVNLNVTLLKSELAFTYNWIRFLVKDLGIKEGFNQGLEEFAECTCCTAGKDKVFHDPGCSRVTAFEFSMDGFLFDVHLLNFTLEGIFIHCFAACRSS